MHFTTPYSFPAASVSSIIGGQPLGRAKILSNVIEAKAEANDFHASKVEVCGPKPKVCQRSVTRRNERVQKSGRADIRGRIIRYWSIKTM
jgi:hypothetical protein